MKAATQIALGFMVAFFVATGIVWLHHLVFPLPPEEASGGMAAFGDLVLFAGVFTLAAIIPTIGLLRLLNGVRAFWSVWTIVAVLLVLTGIVSGFMYVLPSLTGAHHFPVIYSLAPLRILSAAPLAIGFALSGALAPPGTNRKVLLGCAGAEIIVFAAAALKMVLSNA
jgi:hypothetical protein